MEKISEDQKQDYKNATEGRFKAGLKNLGKSQQIIPSVTEWELKNLKINKHIILILFLLLIPNMLLWTTNILAPMVFWWN